MTLNDLSVRLKVIDSFNAAKMTKYGLVMSQRYVVWLGALYIRPTYPCARLLTYLHNWLGAYKTGNIFETVEDKAKVTINGLYKVAHGFSIASKMCDLE